MNLLTVYYGKNREALALLQKNTQKGFGYFYIVEFSEDLVKIGCTRHPASRMEQLSCTIAKEVGLPIKRIAVSGKCKYFQKYEKIMHNAFKKERIEGSELFRVSFDTAVKVGTFLIRGVFLANLFRFKRLAVRNKEICHAAGVFRVRWATT